MRRLIVLLWTVSRRELAARPVRSMLVAGTIATGVALLTAMRVATDSTVTGFAADLERMGGRADLQVTFGTGEAGFPEELLARVAAEPFVEQAAALVRSSITFEDEPRETVELFGIDVLQKDVLTLYDVEVLEREKDDFTILNDPRGIFVTDTIARERGLSLGSTTRMSGIDGVHEYKVRGIVATKGLAEFLGGKLVSMYLPAAQPVAGKKIELTTSMIDQVDVRLRPDTAAAEAAAKLETMLGAGFTVAEPFQRRLLGEHIVEGLRATLVGMSSLVLLAAIFIIYASTTTMVVQRLPAMATLITIGASPRTLLHSVVAEAALLAMVGSVGGVGLGLALSSFIGADVAVGMGLNYSIAFEGSRLSIDPWMVFVVHPMVGVVTAAVSAYLPARRLRSVAPLVLQRDEDALVHRPTLSIRGAVLLAAAVIATGMLVLTHGVSRGAAGSTSFGGVLLIVGAVLGTLPVLRVAWTASVAPLSRVAGVAGRIAGENLLRALDRSLVTASAIALSCAVAVGASSLVQSFRASVTDWYGFSGDALVSSRSVTGGWLASPISQRLEEPLRSLADVRDVETLRVLQGQPFRGERIAIAALSDGLVRRAVELGTTVAGLTTREAGERIAEGKGVAVSRNFASHFGVAGGDLLLSTLTGEWRVPVVAIVPDYVSDKGSILLGRRQLAARWNDALVNYYAVDFAEEATVGSLRAQVESALPGSEALAVTATADMVARVDGLIGEAFADIDTIKLLVLFLTAVGIADLVVSNVFSRRRELAVLRIVGLADSQVIRTARLEGLCLTIGASVCGAVVGVLCAWVWVTYNYPVLVGYVLDFSLSWTSIATCIVVSLVAAFAAGTVGARYALRQPALATIRFE